VETAIGKVGLSALIRLHTIDMFVVLLSGPFVGRWNDLLLHRMGRQEEYELLRQQPMN